jgi:hypothetical protein
MAVPSFTIADSAAAMQAAAPPPGAAPAHVAAVSVKVPKLNRSEPENWFLGAEVQFQLSNVTKESTKYFHMVGALDDPDLTLYRQTIKKWNDLAANSSKSPLLCFQSCRSQESGEKLL